MPMLKEMCRQLGWPPINTWKEFAEKVKEVEAERDELAAVVAESPAPVPTEPVEEPANKPVQQVGQQSDVTRSFLQDAIDAVDAEIKHFSTNPGAISLLTRVKDTLSGESRHPVTADEAQRYADGAGRPDGQRMWALTAQALREREQHVEQAELPPPVEEQHQHSHDNSVESQLEERFGPPPDVEYRQESHSHQNDHPERVVNPVRMLGHNGSGEVSWDIPDGVNWKITEDDNLWYTIYTDFGNGWEKANASLRESWGQRSTHLRHALQGRGGKALVKVITTADGTTASAESEVITVEMHDPLPSAPRNLRLIGPYNVEWDAPERHGDGELTYSIMAKPEGDGWSQMGTHCRESRGERSKSLGLFLYGKSALVKVVAVNPYGRAESEVLEIKK